MELFTKTEDGVKTSFDVPLSTLLGGAGIIGVINALSTLLSSWLITLPNNQSTMELREKNFKVQLLQRILESKEPSQRANSLKFLINAKLLDDADGLLMKIAGKPENVPQWSPHPIETLNGALENTASAPSSTSGLSTDQPNPPTTRIPVSK